MKIVSLVIAMFLLSVLLGAQGKVTWQQRSYHVLVDGNHLYSECQSYEQNTRSTDDRVEYQTTATPSDLVHAGQCWGYVLGVVDSIPADEGFAPEANVRASQYVDVVFKYLQDHPEQRQYSGYGLVRTALTEAFPAK